MLYIRVYYSTINPVFSVFQVKNRHYKKKAIKGFIKLYNIKSQDLELLDIKEITEKEFNEENIWIKYKGDKK